MKDQIESEPGRREAPRLRPAVTVGKFLLGGAFLAALSGIGPLAVAVGWGLLMGMGPLILRPEIRYLRWRRSATKDWNQNELRGGRE